MFDVGQRIQLVSMPNDPNPVPTGTKGMVRSVNTFQGRTQVAVAWDNGRSLALAVPPDYAIPISE